jgi:hypothetical protein
LLSMEGALLVCDALWGMHGVIILLLQVGILIMTLWKDTTLRRTMQTGVMWTGPFLTAFAVLHSMIAVLKHMESVKVHGIR